MKPHLYMHMNTYCTLRTGSLKNEFLRHYLELRERGEVDLEPLPVREGSTSPDLLHKCCSAVPSFSSACFRKEYREEELSQSVG